MVFVDWPQTAKIRLTKCFIVYACKQSILGPQNLFPQKVQYNQTAKIMHLENLALYGIPCRLWLCVKHTQAAMEPCYMVYHAGSGSGRNIHRQQWNHAIWYTMQALALGETYTGSNGTMLYGIPCRLWLCVKHTQAATVEPCYMVYHAGSGSG